MLYLITLLDTLIYLLYCPSSNGNLLPSSSSSSSSILPVGRSKFKLFLPLLLSLSTMLSSPGVNNLFSYNNCLIQSPFLFINVPKIVLFSLFCSESLHHSLSRFCATEHSTRSNASVSFPFISCPCSCTIRSSSYYYY